MRSYEKAVESARVYVDATTPYYYGSKVWIEVRQYTPWTEVNIGGSDE
jgi:hypothetical protein